MKVTAWRVLVTVLVMTSLLNPTMATTTQAVFCAGSGGLLLGVGIGLGKCQDTVTERKKMTFIIRHRLPDLLVPTA